MILTFLGGGFWEGVADGAAVEAWAAVKGQERKEGSVMVAITVCG